MIGFYEAGIKGQKVAGNLPGEQVATNLDVCIEVHLQVVKGEPHRNCRVTAQATDAKHCYYISVP